MFIGLLIAVATTASVQLPAPLAPPSQASVGALAAEPFFHTLDVADGLPSSSVWKLAQDHSGFIWIGTADGLARFDGVGFRIYRHNAADATSLSGNDVTALFVDHQGRLWCGGEDAGLNRLDAQGNGFVHYRHDPKSAVSLASNDVWTIGQTVDGIIWVGGYASGLDRLNPDTNTFVHYRHDPANAASLASDNVLAVFGDRNANLWIGTDAGIDVMNGDGRFRHVDLSALQGSGRVNAIAFLQREHDMLVATRRGVLRIDANLKASVLVDAGLGDKVVYGLARGRHDAVWIATRDGLARWNTDGDVDAYSENAAVPGSFPGKKVFDALRDREGGLWFATTDGGVAYLPPDWRNFALYRHDPGNPLSISENRVEGIAAAANGAIWAVNLDGGIDRLDPASGTVERFAPRWSAPDKTLWSVLEDREGQLWVGHAHGLRVYQTSSGKFRDLPVDRRRADTLFAGTVDQLVQAGDDAVWASSNGAGLQRIDAHTFAIQRYDDSAGLRSADIGQIGFAPDGTLLVANAAGLDRFDSTTQRFVAVTAAPAQRVLAFAFARDGTLWLHTTPALSHYRYQAGALVLLDKVDAESNWPDLTAGSMQVDARGRVWVSSARGLWRFDPATRAIRRFGNGDGLASAEFNRLPMIQTANGAIFGGTLAGIVGFEPTHIVENAIPPPLVLDRVSLRRNGRELIQHPRDGRIDMRWDDRDLTLRARALSFANPAANRYQWQLAGYDSDWIDSGQRGERVFSQLPAGDYALRVRAASAGSTWSKPLMSLRVRVAPAPWATPWAYALYAAGIALALAIAFRTYRVRLKRRHALELAEQQRRFAEHASNAKSEFLATMGHEIRTPMTGVLGMTELLLRTQLDATQRNYAQSIETSGKMMLRLVNDSLDLARIEAGKLELQSEPVDLHALLRELSAVGQTLAQAKSLDWKLRIDADAPRWVRGDGVRIKQILLNLANNAIKFTQNGQVELALSRGDDESVKFCVRDTGPGIAQPTRARLFERFEQADGPHRNAGSGLGLAICRELVARMGGTIALDSTPGVGSLFTVVLPLPIVDRADVDVAVDAARSDRARKSLVADADTARRILLVEDNATVAAVIIGLLQAQGHRVAHAAHGLAALSELESADYDLALIDLDLPGIDGLTLARMLRASEATNAKPRLRLIGLSARSVGDEESLCREAGMDAFLRKPVTGAMLAKVLAARQNHAPALTK
ncbi:MAG TPA: two-component regulator propeller domain-containing protein [Rudaea sp.]|nr:two-component regulator propeller domain-containing protein [Rudaea sp.]